MAERPSRVHGRAGAEPPGPQGRVGRAALAVAAAAWGFAEATLFFVVPDVLLTAAAATGRVSSARLAGLIALAVCGALLGGSVMYAWGRGDPAGARTAVLAVPLIDESLVQEIERTLEERGAVGMAAGGFRGQPYKVYSIVCAEQSVGYPRFLLISIAARAPRFVLAVLFTWAICRTVARRWPLRARMITLGVVWAAIYGYYIWSRL